MDGMFASPQNLYVKVIPPKVIVFGGGPFGRCLGVDEVMKVGSS